ncbi:MAG: cytochrome c, partial [Bacteroidota bacterium]
LDLNDEKQANLNIRLDDPANYPSLIGDLKKQYLIGSPATFHDAPENRKDGFAYEGRPEKGQQVYDHSCKHCHENGRYSFFELDDSKASFRFLKKHFVRYTRYSTYHVTAYGAPSRPGKRAYMPHYPLEKLSLQQIEDLRAFFESKL